MSTLRVDNLNARTGNNIIVPTGTKFYAPGHVIQVVQVTSVTPVTTSSTTWANTGLVASITPSYINSKILVNTNMVVRPSTGTQPYGGGGIRLVRNLIGSDTTIVDSVSDTTGPFTVWNNLGVSGNYTHNHNFNYLDSPSTTSPVTYRTQGRLYATGGGNSIEFNTGGFGGSNSIATITLMEIGV